MKPKHPSIRSLQESLRAANAETQGYLDELVRLRERVKELEQLRREVDILNRLAHVLMRALEDAQERRNA